MPPLLFHEVHGEWVKLFEDSTILRRLPSPAYKGGLAFSNRPVKIGEKVCLRLLKDGKGWLGLVTFGFTKHNPENLKSNILPEDINSSAAKRAGFWSVFADRHFYHEDDVLFFCVNSLGTVQYGINDENKGTFDISEQCDRIQLWAMVDINVDDMIIQFVNPLTQNAEDDLQPQNENKEPREVVARDEIFPLLFHPKSGDHAKVSFDGCTARLRSQETLESSSLLRYCFPDLRMWASEILPPLRFNGKYSIVTARGYVETRCAVFSARTITIDEKICLHFMSGSGDVTFGFTSYNPDIKNEEIDDTINFKHWGVEIKDVTTLEDNKLYYYVNSTGDICFGNNDEDLGMCFSAVDTNIPLRALLILPDDAVVQFVDPKSTQVGPSTATKFPTVMRFHPVHADVDVVSRDGSKAITKSRYGEGYGIVFTYRPVGINERISLRIAVNEKLVNSYLLTFGFTNQDPTLLSCKNPKSLKQADRGKILLKGHKIIFHIYVDSLGEVHFWCEGDSERRSMSAIDIRSRFWMFVKTNVRARMYFVETSSKPPPCKYVYNLSPMEFHYIHGKNLFRQYSRVQCIRDESPEECLEGLAFSSKPIVLNKKICLRILAIADEKTCIQIGVTSLPPTLPSRICQNPASKSKIWTRIIEKEFCKENNNIYFYVNSSGEVIYGINGQEKGILTSGVDISGDIYALVDVSGLSTIVIFTNAVGIHKTVDEFRMVDQRSDTGPFMKKHEEFEVESMETDNEIMLEVCPTINNSLKFHSVHSRNVKVSKDGFEAQLVDEEDFRSGLAFTNRPIDVDEQICLRIKNYEYESCLLIFGFINSDPENLTEAVRKNVFKPYLMEISLHMDANLYVRLTPTGDVHFWTDELENTTNYFEGIGANRPVWMLIELPNMPATMNILEPGGSDMIMPTSGTTYNLHPLYFHSVHGSNVSTFTKMTAEVECMCPSTAYRDGVAFTSRTISVNEKVHLRILSNQNKDIDIKLGFTSHNPSSLSGQNNFNGLTDHRTWTKTLKKRYYKYKNDICFYVNSAGEVYFEVNRKEKGLFFEGVDVTSPLWALVEISGAVTLMFLNSFGRFRFPEYSSFSYLIDDNKASSFLDSDGALTKDDAIDLETELSNNSTKLTIR